METEGAIVEEPPLVLSGLAAFETGEADFADYLILERARRAEALPLWTFDGPLAKAEGAARGGASRAREQRLSTRDL